MLRRDGKEIPCVCHFYGSKEDAEETLYAAEWLYEATGNANTRQRIIEFVAAYGALLNPHRNLIRNLYMAIKEKPYKFLSYDFVQSHADELSCVNSERIDKLNSDIIHRLNSEFLRVRLGGMLNTVPGNRDLYFRVSDKHFNWFPIIFESIQHHCDEADTVSVLWDWESTGHNEYLTNKSGHIMDHIPLRKMLNSHRWQLKE